MKVIIFVLVFFSLGCAHQSITLYENIGGEKTVDQITNNFIDEIGNDKIIIKYFEKSNIDRFHKSFSSHLCSLTDGPCEYSGDNMQEVHRGMNITEGDFNRTVNLLINAMKKSGLSHRQMNRVLARLAPHQKNIIYQ
jgi:hemoglobin